MRSNWPKCPSCKSQEIAITEIWGNHTISWDHDTPENEGILNPGDPEKVIGLCNSCGHTWRFRKIIQVDPEWFEDNNIGK